MIRRNTQARIVTALLCVALWPATAANAQTQAEPLIVRALELTNTERQHNGLAPLAFSSELSHAAQAYSVAMASSDCFAHTCGPLPQMADRAANAGYTGWTILAENIGMGYTTPESVVQGWMDSAGHRDNLLSPRFTEIGIGVATSGGLQRLFWTQNFGARPAAPRAPMVIVPTPEPKVTLELEVAPEVASVPDPELPPEGE